MIVKIRKKTGLSGPDLALVVNESLIRAGRPGDTISGSTATMILRRHGVIAWERHVIKTWRFFERPRPNHLIQVDLTEFKGIPIFTALDDYSRFAWGGVLRDEQAVTIVKEMEKQLPESFLQ